MTWTKSEKESLGTMIENAVSKGNEPTKAMIQELHQTVHGTKEARETGLASRMTRQERFNKTTLYIFTIVTAIGAAFTAFLLLFHSGILKIG